MADIQSIPGPDGRTIAYRRAGKGRPVLLLHGITEDSASFAPVQARLAETYDTVALDMAGHGASTTPQIAGLGEILGDAMLLLSALTIEAPLLVGHSYGGTVAAALAAQGVGRAALLIDQPMELSGFRQQLLSIRTELEGPNFTKTYCRMCDELGIDAVPSDLRAHLDALHANAKQEMVLAQWAGVMGDDIAAVDDLVRQMLGAIKQPLLSLHGSDEDTAYAAWLKALAPQAEVEFWPGKGHWLHLVEPDRFCARLRAFDG